VFRAKRTRLIHQHLEGRGLIRAWWDTAEAAVNQCEEGHPLEPLFTGAGPVPARSVVALMGLEPFVEGGVDWTIDDDLADPGGAFYPPNNDLPMPTSDEGRLLLQQWFFPSG
jgi:hypothetical protein